MKDDKQRTYGLDAHPDSFTVAVLVGSTAATASVERTSGPHPIDHLQTWFAKHARPGDAVPLEASSNSFALFDKLQEIGLHPLVLDSKMVGQMAKANCINDKISAVKVARIYLTGLVEKVWVPDPDTRRRREFFSAYEQAVKDETRNRNRVTSFLNEHTIRLSATDARVLHRPATQQKILKQRNWDERQHILIEEGLADIERARTKRDRFRKAMCREIVACPTMLKLTRIFGMQKIAVYGLWAAIGDIKRFSHPKKLVSYLGLCPGLKASGKNSRTTGLVRGGRRDCRCLLIQAAHVVMRYDSKSNRLYKWAQRLAFRKGSKLVAIAAVARKIAVAIWYILNGKPFEPREDTDTLHRKLRQIMLDAGVDFAKAHGYKNCKDFARRIIEGFHEEVEELDGQPPSLSVSAPTSTGAGPFSPTPTSSTASC